jgi:hypothetical protein
VSGGNEVTSVALQLGHVAEPPRDRSQKADREPGLLLEQSLEVPAGNGEADGVLLGDHARDAGHLVEDRDLAEDLARAEVRDRDAVVHDPDAASDDEEEAGSDLALARAIGRSGGNSTSTARPAIARRAASSSPPKSGTPSSRPDFSIAVSNAPPGWMPLIPGTGS